MLTALNKYGFSKTQWVGLILFVLVGIGHNFIANEESGLPALIPYNAHSLDNENRNIGPFSEQKIPSLYYRHWLGTDNLGRDLLAGLIHGTYIALKISALAMLLTILIGIFFGYLSGYIGDSSFRLEKKLFLICFLLLGIVVFYLWYGTGMVKALSAIAGIGIISLIVLKSDSNRPEANSIAIPFDLLTMRLIEIFKAIPRVFLLLILIAMFRKANFTNVIFIIALIRWPTVTRYLRAEILKLKEEDFVLSARALGLSKLTIFKDHILPLAISPVIVATAFGFSAAILLESTLSFLGIGIPLDQVTWGTILNGARYNFSSWWLALFPGLMIFMTVLLFNSLGDRLSDYYRGE